MCALPSPAGTTALNLPINSSIALMGSQHQIDGSSCPNISDDLRMKIDKTAEYCAQNPGLEDTIRVRDENDPQFAFLRGGEGAAYYQWRLGMMNAGIPANQVDALYQSSRSKFNTDYMTHQTVPSDLPQKLDIEYDLVSLVQHYSESGDVDSSLSAALEAELRDMLRTLEHDATADAIRASRHWFELSSSTREDAKKVWRAVQSFVENSTTPNHRLNILYVMHDVVQNHAAAAKKHSSMDASGQPPMHMKPCLVWIARAAYQPEVSSNEDIKEKVLEILSLWLDHGIVNEDEKEEMNVLITCTALPTNLIYSSHGNDPQSCTPNIPRVNESPSPSSTTHVYSPVMPHPPPMSPHHGVPHPPFHSPMPPSYYPLPAAATRPLGYPTGAGPPHMIPATLTHQSALFPPILAPLTPESIPVGLLATCMKNLSKRAKKLHVPFVPFKPLDAQMTPQSMPIVEPPGESLLHAFHEFETQFQNILAKFENLTKQT